MWRTWLGRGLPDLAQRPLGIHNSIPLSKVPGNHECRSKEILGNFKRPSSRPNAHRADVIEMRVDPTRLESLVINSKPRDMLRYLESALLYQVQRGACFPSVICLVRQFFGVVWTFFAYTPGEVLILAIS